jgi:hypothetical protein
MISFWFLVAGGWRLEAVFRSLVTGDPFARDLSSFKKLETSNLDLNTYSAMGDEKQNITSKSIVNSKWSIVPWSCVE